WVLARALELLEDLPEPRRRELTEHIDLADDEPARWEEVSHRLHLPFHDGVISQFDGYGDLAELDWADYRERYGDIRRLDRILEAEGDTVNRYKASKQADVLMLGYLFSPPELRSLVQRLGYRLDERTWTATVDHYLHRTSHGSTLSGLVHGWILARARRAAAWSFVQEALRGDIADLQGGTTGEGIHLGAMAGTLDLVQRGLTGLETRGGALRLDPVPLPELSSYGFAIRYHGHWGVRLRLRSGLLEIAVPDSDRSPIDIRLRDRAVPVRSGETARLVLPD
ncbi:glycosyl hydrolase family 65 protein, partial [Streptomyces sp. SID161]|uniref:glycosyl hydrolase family 65 protein n=2 Tax=unclassified Streptomyces TaxID=2593676 RepID=UPI0013FC0B43